MLSRDERVKPTPSDQLYPLSVVEEDDDRQMVKVHYEGFSSKYDECRAKDIAIVDLQPGDDDVSQDYDAVEDTDSGLSSVISPFSLYHELLMDVKVSLTSGRKKILRHVKLRMLFDKFLFDGGLRVRCVAADGVHGKYTIKEYSNLSDILGPDWYYRGLNEHGDF